LFSKLISPGKCFVGNVSITLLPKVGSPSPDFKVDIRDIAYVAKAFGSHPGHERWSPFADISCDYKIDIRDIAMIASKFGWSG